jgi:hypothetical protein
LLPNISNAAIANAKYLALDFLIDRPIESLLVEAKGKGIDKWNLFG